MGGASEELDGPDLKEGVTASEVTTETPLLGHFEGDAVLVVRRGEALFGIAGNCSHYGGPLSQGLLQGDTVRCPWHHACFDLRTGEAVRAPALSDLPTYQVVEEGERIRVVSKSDPPGTLALGASRRGRSPASAPASVVIVGGGAAGNAAAECLRREGYVGPITIVEADADEPCDRPNLSKDYLQGTAPEDWIPLRPAAFFEENDIVIRRARAVSLDTAGRDLTLDDGTTLSYGALILSPGAEPVRLDLPTAEGAQVFTLRTLTDSRQIIAAAEGADRVVILGASFIGLEVAASLLRRGLEVHVVAPEDVPLASIMGSELGQYIHGLHAGHGVRFHLGHTAREIGHRHVVLDDGTRLDTDFVVMGVGVRPRTELAKLAGLETEDGIVVDADLRTSVDGVWAAGDAARFPDPRTGERIRVEHWVVAERMGAAAARSVLGRGQEFTDAPFFWSQHYDTVIAYVGHAKDWDASVVDGDPAEQDCAVRFEKDGRLLALATVFRDELSLATELEMERSARR